ncbi:MAG: hypothetical protein WAM72_22915 [Xanthobacteraceae bacterium]
MKNIVGWLHKIMNITKKRPKRPVGVSTDTLEKVLERLAVTDNADGGTGDNAYSKKTQRHETDYLHFRRLGTKPCYVFFFTVADR